MYLEITVLSEVSDASFFSSLLNVTRVVSSYLCIPVLLPGVYGERLYVVNVQSREYHSTPIHSESARFFPIDNVTAVCMMGKPHLERFVT